MRMKKTLLSWSSGKDSAWTLYTLQQRSDVELLGLVTTVNQTHQRVAMHAVRLVLLEQQAAAANLPLHIINIPHPCSNEKYNQAMDGFFDSIQQIGATHMAFGDLFLEDIRQYREENLKGTGLTPMFPLWLEPTEKLAQKMIDAGLKTRITCIDPNKLSANFAGREFNQQFLDDLPDGIDPCGENGEFHSFTYAGPMFKKPINISTGDVVEREGFIFADLQPEGSVL
ncbi:MAG: ATP-binding protein [Cycloclasticus sp.]|nr:ATP-binding protein [Cycloclasticus sp.]MBG95601.1 ATP-binding protein [Cycloclasticus sp.]HAI96380.1 ATP-binding protein [Methylococcaceae bacterium]|tara:strand:- start:46 stop:726 length:681 start_codon:yes stop_codon:yes gene_type:complete